MRRPFAPGTQGSMIDTLSSQRSRLGIKPVDLFSPEAQERPINTSSSRRSRLGIKSIDLLHQQTMEDRLTPLVPEEVV